MFKVKGPLLKPKLKKKIKFFFEFLNTHISHLAQLPMITMDQSGTTHSNDILHFAL
jgi:hypothetical protein